MISSGGFHSSRFFNARSGVETGLLFLLLSKYFTHYSTSSTFFDVHFTKLWQSRLLNLRHSLSLSYVGSDGKESPSKLVSSVINVPRSYDLLHKIQLLGRKLSLAGYIGVGQNRKWIKLSQFNGELIWVDESLWLKRNVSRFLRLNFMLAISSSK